MYCYTIECYKGYYIDADNITGKDEYSIWLEGDDVLFNTLEEARAFIDKLVADNYVCERPQLGTDFLEKGERNYENRLY